MTQMRLSTTIRDFSQRLSSIKGKDEFEQKRARRLELQLGSSGAAMYLKCIRAKHDNTKTLKISSCHFCYE